MSAVAEVRVSVVMIFRDPGRAFFDEAVASVLTQTLAGVELLLCDDGSQPDSTEAARGWADQHPDRVRCLEHPGHAHRGMSATRNLGIAAAQASLVAFLDADDVWLPGHLEHEVALLEAHPEAGAACGRALDWYSWDQAAGPVDRWSRLPFPAGSVAPPPRMLTAVLTWGGYSTPTCSLLVRRELLRGVGGGEEEFTGMFEDQVLLAKLYLTVPVVISGGRTALYRRHAGSSSALAEAAGLYDPTALNQSHLAYVRWLAARPQLGGEGADWAELRTALRSTLDRYEGFSTQPAARDGMRAELRRRVPAPVRRAVRSVRRRLGHLRGGGTITFGDLRRTTPISRSFGYDRGQPVDRHYIEDFLGQHRQLIRGRVLEVGDGAYTRTFGAERVERIDVLNVAAGHPETTIVGDLTDAPQIPSDTFDCLVITQTLHLLYDLPAAVATLRRILKPGGSLLATVPGISPLSSDVWAESWYWSLTPWAARRLFDEEFGEEFVDVASCGNVLTSIAFLAGLAAHELTPGELADTDPQFPMLVTIRADRPA